MSIDGASPFKTIRLTVQREPGPARGDATRRLEAAELLLGSDASQPVHLVVHDQAGATHRFAFADHAALVAFLGDASARLAAEPDASLRALLLEARGAIDRPGNRAVFEALAARPARGDAPATARGLTTPESNSAMLRSVRTLPEEPRPQRARSFEAGYFASLPQRASAFAQVLDLELPRDQLSQTIARADKRLMSILREAAPGDIKSRLVAEFSGASELERLAVGAALAQLLVAYTYNHTAYAANTQPHTSPAQSLAALQSALRTGRPVEDGVCGDIHVAVADLQAALGNAAGVGRVDSHVVSLFRTQSGTYVINDYGQLYAAKNPVELFARYEAVRGQVLLWHYVGDESGRIVGRVQTPLGAFVDQTVSPSHTLQAFLRGERLPAGHEVHLQEARDGTTGSAGTTVALQPGMTARLEAGAGQPGGHLVRYTVVGFGIDNGNFRTSVNAGRYDVDYATGQNEKLLVYEVAAGWRDELRLGRDRLAYGAGYRASGIVDLANREAQDSNLQATLGARYEHPLATGVGSSFVTAELHGLRAGRLQDSAAFAGAREAQLRALTFENHELEVGAGIRLARPDGETGLRTQLKRSGDSVEVGVAAEHRDGATSAKAELGAARATMPFGRSGVRLQAGVKHQLSERTTLGAALTEDATAGSSLQLGVEHKRRIELPSSMAEPVRRAIENVGVDPASVAVPKEGLERGLQLRALLALQQGEHVSRGALGALGLQVDPVDSTLVLPAWLKDRLPPRLDIAGTAQVTLGNLRQVDLGPALALNAEFGAWGMQVLASLNRVQATVGLGEEQRWLAGAALGFAGPGASLELLAGRETRKRDGSVEGLVLSTRPELTLTRGSQLFGDQVSSFSAGFGGIRRVELKNPGVMEVDPASGDIFAYKQARAAQGYLDLFQYVTRPPEQKEHIRRIVARLGDLAEAGLGAYFEPAALADLGGPEKLAQLSDFLASPDFAAQVQRLRAQGGDSIVFDAVGGEGQTYYDAGQGDLHIARLPLPETVEVRQGASEPLSPERRAVVEAWRARGLRLVGVGELSDEEYTGLHKLLGFLDANLDPAQLVNKQISFRERSMVRSLGEALGLVSLHHRSAAGATIALSPRLMQQLARAHLGPSEVVLAPELSETQRQTAAKLMQLVRQRGLDVNGTERLVFVGNASFEAATLSPHANEAGPPPVRFFERQGNTILVNAEALGGEDLEHRLGELRRAMGGRVLEALEALRAESTQHQRNLSVARASGRGVLYQYHPEQPPRSVAEPEPGMRYTYRIFDAYGRPAEGKDGKPLGRSYELFFPEDRPELTLTVRPDDGTRPTSLPVKSSADVRRVLERYPEIAPVIDGLTDNPSQKRLPGLRLLHRMRQAVGG